MKRLFTFVALCLIPTLAMSHACQPKDDGHPEYRENPGNQEKQPKPDPFKADLTTLEGQWRDSVHTALSYAYQDEVLKIGQYKMPIWWKVYGNKPADGRSLYISLHGGGGAPAATNNQQWENQKRLYEPAEGVYLCPRAITDTWDLHFRPESDGFYEQIIQMAVVFLDVNPNKVYIMGYSAGGDGVWRIAPRMADHWAAASMMAGHPGDVSLLPLRNLPFMIWCGALDDAYNRNKECEARIKEMDETSFLENPTGWTARIGPPFRGWRNTPATPIRTRWSGSRVMSTRNTSTGWAFPSRKPRRAASSMPISTETPSTSAIATIPPSGST